MADDDVVMSASEAKALKGAYDLMNKLYSHPEKGMDFKKLAKGAGFNVPELDTIEKVTKPYDEKMTAYEAENKKLKDRLDKWEADNLSEKEEAALSKEIKAVQKESGLTEEGMKKVIERMKEKNNLDVEAAAAWVLSKEPKPQPTKTSHNFSQSKFNGKNLSQGGDSESVEKLLSGKMSNDDYFDHVVNDVLNSPENQIELGGTN